MAVGSYNVQHAEDCPEKRDTSFKSCICALFAVLFVCICLILVTAFVRGSSKDKGSVKDAFDNQQQNQDYVTKLTTKLTTRVFTSTSLKSVTDKPEVTFAKTTTVPSGKEQFTHGYIYENRTSVEDQELGKPTTIGKWVFNTQQQNQDYATNFLEVLSTQSTTPVFNALITWFSTKSTLKPLISTTGKAKEVITKNTTVSNENFTEELTTPTINTQTTSFSTKSSLKSLMSTTEETEDITTKISTISNEMESDLNGYFHANQTTDQDQVEVEKSTTVANELVTFETTLESFGSGEFEFDEVFNPEAGNVTYSHNIQNSTITAQSTQKDNQTTTVAITKPFATTTKLQETTEVTQASLSSEAYSVHNLNTFSEASDVCETPSCKAASVSILKKMNHAAYPCEDFYEFACGQYTSPKAEEHETFLLYIQRINSNSSEFLKQAKVFFDSCVSHESEFLSNETIWQARQLVDNVGELRINNSRDVTVQDLSELLAKLVMRQSVPFFDVDVNVHSSNGSSKYVLQLTLPQHSTSEWSSLSENRRRCLRLQSGKTYKEHVNLTEIYEEFIECQTDYSVYLNSVENVLRTLGMLENVKNGSQLLGIVKEIRFTVEDILKILETLPPPYEVRRFLINQETIIMTLNELIKNFPQLDWPVFMNTLTGLKVPTGASIAVSVFDYFVKAFGDLYSLGYKKVYNALLAIYAQDVYSNIVFEPITSKREYFCVARAFDLFPDVVNYIYTINERNLDAERNISSIIFNKLKAQMSSSLDSAANWMESDVIVQFKAELDKMTLRFKEHSDLDLAELESSYPNGTMEPNAYVRNLEEAMVRRREKLYALWGENFKQKQVFRTFLKPNSKQPFRFPNTNILYIPDGMLKDIHEDLPFYLSTSSVGWRLAKAVARISDPVNVKQILPNSNTFNSLIENTKEQLKYINEVKFAGRTVTFNWNGSLSVNERIVENTAFRLLLDASQPDDAYNELPLPWISLSYSREKLSFIATIQEFCEETSLLTYMERIHESENLPASLMAANVLINSQSFATTFDCKIGSGMNMFGMSYQFPYLEKLDDYGDYSQYISN